MATVETEKTTTKRTAKPKAEVVETAAPAVAEAEWVEVNVIGGATPACSNCGEFKPVTNAFGNHSHANFCPNCGRKMKVK